jgi:hypothetical protein
MRLWVDFNDIEDHDYVEADLDNAESFREDELREGVRVDLFDGGGHESQGEVVAVDLDEKLVRVKIDWATWRSPTRLSDPVKMAFNVETIIFVSSRFEPRPPDEIEQSERHPATISP